MTVALPFEVQVRREDSGEWERVSLTSPGDAIQYVLAIRSGPLRTVILRANHDVATIDVVVAGMGSRVKSEYKLGMDDHLYVLDDLVSGGLCYALTRGPHSAVPSNERFVVRLVHPGELVLAATACECGAAKCGVGRGMAGHSPWCPWKGT